MWGVTVPPESPPMKPEEGRLAVTQVTDNQNEWKIVDTKITLFLVIVLLVICVGGLLIPENLIALSLSEHFDSSKNVGSSQICFYQNI